MSTLIMSKCWLLQLEPSQKSVLISLADNANDEGICWPSTEIIARRTCLSERTVQRSITALVNIGYLQIYKRSGRSNVYKIILGNISNPPSSSHPCHPVGGDIHGPKGCHDDTKGVTACQSGGDTVTPRTVIEPKVIRKEPLLGENDTKVNVTQKVTKASLLPEKFEPNFTHISLAAQLGIDLKLEFAKFCDHARANGKSYQDWNAALNNWLRNSVRFWVNQQKPKTNVISQAKNEIPPGFSSGNPEINLTKEEWDALPY